MIEDSALPTMNLYYLVLRDFLEGENLYISFLTLRKKELVLDFYGCLDSELL